MKENDPSETTETTETTEAPEDQIGRQFFLYTMLLVSFVVLAFGLYQFKDRKGVMSGMIISSIGLFNLIGTYLLNRHIFKKD